jgi:hypothetical protein
MVYEDAEKLYGEVCTDAEAVTDNALCVLYPGSIASKDVGEDPLSKPSQLLLIEPLIFRLYLTVITLRWLLELDRPNRGSGDAEIQLCTECTDW